VRALEVVAAVIIIFFGLGIAMGVLIVVALPHRRGSKYLHDCKRDEPPTPPEDDDKAPWWPGR
jgi:hypothetical protein